MNPYEIISLSAAVAAMALLVGAVIAWQYEPVCTTAIYRVRLFDNKTGDLIASSPVEQQSCIAMKKTTDKVQP